MSCPSFADHDHAVCRAEALGVAERACAARGLRLTPVRRRVLEVLLEAPRALGAYDLLPTLAAEGLGAQPPVAYRALDFLVGAGFAHRIEKLNAYVACTCPGDPHRPAFLICRGCERVREEAGPDPRRLTAPARANGFRIENTVVEALGLCPDCTP